MRNSKYKIAIIGAGIAGLSTAYELKKLGYDTHLFEKNKVVGGRMASRPNLIDQTQPVKNQKLIFDIGANHLINLYQQMRKYSAELDLEWEKMEFDQYAILHEKKIKKVVDFINYFDGFKLAFLTIGKRRIPDFFNLNQAADLDKKDAYSYLLPKLGKKLTNYLVDGCTAAYQFHQSNEISLGFLIAFLESIRHENKLWELHHLKGGMSALPEAIIKKLNSDFIHLEEEVVLVEKISSEGKSFLVKTDKNQYEFDLIIFASTPKITANLLGQIDPEKVKFLSKIDFAKTISLAYKIQQDLLPKNSVTWCPFIESKSISSFTNEAMKGFDTTQENQTLACIWLHEKYAQEIMQKPDKEIFDLVKNEFRKLLKIEDTSIQIEPYDLQRWEEAMPKFKPGHLTNTKNFWKNHQGKNNIFLVGDYLNFPWTEGSIRCGQKVAELITQNFNNQNKQNVE